jgi:hypothetical protein
VIQYIHCIDKLFSSERQKNNLIWLKWKIIDRLVYLKHRSSWIKGHVVSVHSHFLSSTSLGSWFHSFHCDWDFPTQINYFMIAPKLLLPISKSPVIHVDVTWVMWLTMWIRMRKWWYPTGQSGRSDHWKEEWHQSSAKLQCLVHPLCNTCRQLFTA